jgi:hypothetical protein
MPAQGPRLFLLGRRHGDDGQSVAVALDIAVQPLHQRQRVNLVGLDPAPQLIPVLRAHHHILHAHLQELAMQAVAEGTGFVTAMDLLGQWDLFGDPFQKALRSESLGRLRSVVVHLAHHAVTVRVNVDAQFYELGFGSRFGG